jgi:hypothetical protein
MNLRIGAISSKNIFKSVFVNVFEKDSIIDIIKRVENYKPKEFRELLELGDINHLRESIEKTVFYHRDKGDPMIACEPVLDIDVTKPLDIDIEASPVDYYIVLFNSRYYISEAFNANWRTLKKFIKDHEDKRD